MDQLTLSFEPGLTAKYRNLRECCAAGVYRHGLQRVAGKLDAAPSNLSVAVSGESNRKFGVDDLERYLDNFDLDPLFYLVEKHLSGHKHLGKQQLLEKANSLLLEFRTTINQIKD